MQCTNCGRRLLSKAERCTNGRCLRCHAAGACGAGGVVSPGHGAIGGRKYAPEQRTEREFATQLDLDGFSQAEIREEIERRREYGLW